MAGRAGPLEPEASSRPRLLFAARRPPFPVVTGARIRTHRLLTGLASTFETTFVTFDHDEGSPDGQVDRDELTRRLPGIEVVTVPGCGSGKRLAQARTLVLSRSWEYGRYRLPAMGAALEQVAERTLPQIVHFDDLGVAQFGPLANALNVYSAHNIEFQILEGTMRSSHALRRHFARIERAKVEPMERTIWQTMSLCLACSDLDAAAMRSGGARVVVCPNGADSVTPLPTPSRAAGEEFRLVFVGAVSYRPNRLGLEWFIRRVLPRVRERISVRLDVVGTGAGNLVGSREVVLHGRVPSVQPFYEQAHAVIVPVLYGSGTRLKVIEAMAFRRPVVATAAGVEGLRVRAGVDYFEADEPQGFADALIEVARRYEQRDGQLEQMLDSARVVVEPFLWPRIVARLARTYLAESAALADA